MDNPAGERIQSIDILRSLVMVLMIFVNDLGNLKKIPEWLEHRAPGVDGIGLADTVFPAFLFIVGLSLPFAIANRRKKGDSTAQLIGHVLLRTVALIVMGVFLVNGETIDRKLAGLQEFQWDAICCTAFILIWNVYPKSFNAGLSIVLKSIGVLTLLALAYRYRGIEEGHVYRFGPQWWGILGLIGWAYLGSALIVIFSKNTLWIVALAWIFFAAVSVLYASRLIGHGDFLSFIPDPILGGTLIGLTLGGVLSSLIFSYYMQKKDRIGLTIAFVGIAVLIAGLCLYTHRFFIIAKLGATPPWLFLCSAITLMAFLLIYWIADGYHKANWFGFIKAAGTDTLLCYLIPYFLNALMEITHLRLGDAVITGTAGLIKALVFALICVWVTFGLNKIGIKLKL